MPYPSRQSWLTLLAALSVCMPPPPPRPTPSEPTMEAWSETAVGHPAPWIRRNLDEFAPEVVFVPTARSFRYGSVPTVALVRDMESLLRPVRGKPVPEALRA